MYSREINLIISLHQSNNQYDNVIPTLPDYTVRGNFVPSDK